MKNEIKATLSNASAMAMSAREELLNNKKFTLGSSLITCGMMLMSNMAYADAATQLFELFITVMGGIIVVIGVILALIGIISYALAMSDADGPQKKKAGMEIAAGLSLLVLSITLIAKKSEFSALITTS